MKPHKHAVLIHAWADGADIQFRSVPNHGDWHDGNENLIWDEWAEYRVKPEPKPDVSQHYFATRAGTTKFSGDTPDMPVNLKLTWDGETGKLKKAEVL